MPNLRHVKNVMACETSNSCMVIPYSPLLVREDNCASLTEHQLSINPPIHDCGNTPRLLQFLVGTAGCLVHPLISVNDFRYSKSCQVKLRTRVWNSPFHTAQARIRHFVVCCMTYRLTVLITACMLYVHNITAVILNYPFFDQWSFSWFYMWVTDLSNTTACINTLARLQHGITPYPLVAIHRFDIAMYSSRS